MKSVQNDKTLVIGSVYLIKRFISVLDSTVSS